jgi:hypothetical protein
VPLAPSATVRAVAAPPAPASALPVPEPAASATGKPKLAVPPANAKPKRNQHWRYEPGF